MATVLHDLGATSDPGIAPLVLRLKPVFELTDDILLQLSAQNGDLRMERNSLGELVIMSPAGGQTGSRNASITGQLFVWSEKDGTGTTFDSSAGFRLSNGALRGPDASWVANKRLAVLTAEEREKYLALCPDFVVELLSPSDQLSIALDKMQEYVDCGVALGLLIVPKQKQVFIYRAGRDVEVIDSPSKLSCEPELPGFVLDFSKIM